MAARTFQDVDLIYYILNTIITFEKTPVDVADSVYLKPDALSRGHGSGLYGALLRELRRRNLQAGPGKCAVHSVLGGIALPNEKSQRLHEKFGFKKVAHLAEVGYKLGRWIDVGYWQLML